MRKQVAAQEIIPNPDPSTLTTALVLRIAEHVKEVQLVRLAGVQGKLESRIDGMDKALLLLQNTIDKSPTIAEINAQFGEKFNNLGNQLAAQANLADKLSIATKEGVVTAFSAAKEAGAESNKSSAMAIAKSEAAFSKQMDQMNDLFTSTAEATNGKISDLKDTVNKLESRILAAEATKKGGQEIWGYLFGAAGILIAVITAVVAVIEMRK